MMRSLRRPFASMLRPVRTPFSVILVAAGLLLLLPGAAWACPVCFDTTAENRMAFMQTTVLLSLLPLGMVGGVGVWIRKRARAMELEGRGDLDGESGSP
jgi:hypothetical protein